MSGVLEERRVVECSIINRCLKRESGASNSKPRLESLIEALAAQTKTTSHRAFETYIHHLLRKEQPHLTCRRDTVRDRITIVTMLHKHPCPVELQACRQH